MRITSGTFKSRIIKAPAGIRPTLDNVRKAIFDILGGSTDGAKVLDLFAGSGALGLEALSRGAGSCVFVDNSCSSVKAIKDNIEALVPQAGQALGAEVIYADSLAAIRRFAGEGAKFDFIFMDPPYYKEPVPPCPGRAGLAKKSLFLLADCDILSKTGVAVIEHSKHNPLPASSGGLRLLRTSRYGDTLVSFYYKGQLK